MPEISRIVVCYKLEGMSSRLSMCVSGISRLLISSTNQWLEFAQEWPWSPNHYTIISRGIYQLSRELDIPQEWHILFFHDYNTCMSINLNLYIEFYKLILLSGQLHDLPCEGWWSHCWLPSWWAIPQKSKVTCWSTSTMAPAVQVVGSVLKYRGGGEVSFQVQFPSELR